jgi:hypothetical protein
MSRSPKPPELSPSSNSIQAHYTKVRKTVWGSFAHLHVAERLQSKIRRGEHSDECAFSEKLAYVTPQIAENLRKTSGFCGTLWRPAG